MLANFVQELVWRGMVQDLIPGTEEALNRGSAKGYIGFDPTASSLTVGNLVAIMLLAHFQRAGHRPVILMGGATGQIGDPSGKSQERNQLDHQTIEFNLNAQKRQLEKFLDFTPGPLAAEMVNNQDWLGKFSLLEFLSAIGKHINISSMLARDSVKSRLETGISFTEFSYQLLQGYDFLHLNRENDVLLQMGGSDQWGNMTTGTDLIRRLSGKEAFCLTCPLLTKADGSKFGKSAEGNIWLDPALTSPYQFYQFWLNASDEDAPKLIRYFTFKGKAEIEELEAGHRAAPHKRVLQKELASAVTFAVHGKDQLDKALLASELLFGGGTREDLLQLTELELANCFDSVPSFSMSWSAFEPLWVLDILAQTGIASSKTEAKKLVDAGGVSLNKVRLTENRHLEKDELLFEKYLVVQKGKKNYHLITFL